MTEVELSNGKKLQAWNGGIITTITTSHYSGSEIDFRHVLIQKSNDSAIDVLNHLNVVANEATERSLRKKFP